MRIAHIITRLIIGGAQENTILTCEGLMRAGDDVLLLTGPPLGPEGSLLERARAGGVPLQIIPELQRAIHPWRDLQSYRRIQDCLRAFRPDVVHTHSGKAGLLGRMAASKLRVPAIVHTVHGAPFHPYQSRAARAVFRQCERFAAARCDKIVSVADAMTDLLVGAGVAPREKFVTIYSGMDVGPFLDSDRHRDQKRRELGYIHEHVVIGKVARLFHLKGHEYVVAAARQVVDEHPQARFLIVGDGLLASQVREQVRRAGLEKNFQFTGLVPPDEIPKLIAAMDIVVHASLREGLARVLPQALIAGRPVVSYDVDGAREVVIPGQTGFLLPPRTIEPLAQSISALVADPQLRVQMGAEGRQRFTAQFDHRHMTEKLRALYESILQTDQPRRR